MCEPISGRRPLGKNINFHQMYKKNFHIENFYTKMDKCKTFLMVPWPWCLSHGTYIHGTSAIVPQLWYFSHGTYIHGTSAIGPQLWYLSHGASAMVPISMVPQPWYLSQVPQPWYLSHGA